MSPVRVLVADDHAVVRAGLINALTSLTELVVVGEVGDGRTLTEALARLKPDFLLVDVAMPDFEPVAAMRAIKADYPNLHVLAVSAYDDEAYVVGLLEAGVDGYHLKDQPLADLHLAIRRILAGDRWISGPLVERLIHHRPGLPPRSIAPLTARQRELLRLLTQSYDNRKIAQIMDLSIKTVEHHLTRLYRTLGVESRLEAVNYAMRHPELVAAAGPLAEPKTRPEAALAVLLVEDNARYRQQFGRLLGRAHASISLYEAEDIAEAVRLTERIKPQLVFVDVVLTEEDGIQCARRLKAIAPATRIVLISAYPDREFRRLGLAAGAVAFLDKKDLDAAAIRQVIADAQS